MRTIVKLIEGNEGYEAGKNKYRISDTQEVVTYLTLEECNALIVNLTAGRSRAVAEWDAQIAAAQARKTELLNSDE